MRWRLRSVARVGRSSLPILDGAGTDAAETLWSRRSGLRPRRPAMRSVAARTLQCAGRRRRSSDLRVQLAQLQFAAEQEFEGFQVAARFSNVAAPAVQDVASDLVAPHVTAAEQGGLLQGPHRHCRGGLARATG